MAFRDLVRFAGVTAATLASLSAMPVAHAAPSQPGDVTPYIVGGTEADVQQYPFVVYLAQPDGFQFCGGSLVSPTKVLTAAHCTKGQTADQMNVVSGRTVKSSQEGTVTKVTNIWIHPNYVDADKGNDVSVLTLEKPVQDAKPIELGKADDPGYKPDTKATILGWGNTSEGGEASDHLMKAEVPISTDDYCKKAYNTYDPKAMVCAGYPKGGTDTCQGDSGGPFVVNGKLLGDTSFGEGCAQPGKPGVYGRVGTYYDMLMKQING